MNYWIHHEVLSKNPDRYSHLINEFFGIVPNLDDFKDCVYKIDHDTYKKLKTLDDLYKDFNNFKKESLPHGADTYENGNTCITLYNVHVEECNKDYKNGFCMKLIDFKNEYEEHMTKLKNCGNMPKYLPAIGSNIATSISIPVVAMSLISFVSYISYKVNNNLIHN
ncbi:hypothetical protein PVBG_05455 [Plasmodium vivax Brazil I]|uniref:Uncharacterized protein n=1 Tax=Plasmodium vivax (strain Brazil I) TaxID=1033975 RepID=A0A0J9ST81_PLAV1|nr:hypothetical protein PVBG_05455 [Plasmodium vivax Brazil I]